VILLPKKVFFTFTLSYGHTVSLLAFICARKLNEESIDMLIVALSEQPARLVATTLYDIGFGGLARGAAQLKQLRYFEGDQK
jgi:hypothetical protein